VPRHRAETLADTAVTALAVLPPERSRG